MIRRFVPGIDYTQKETILLSKTAQPKAKHLLSCAVSYFVFIKLCTSLELNGTVMTPYYSPEQELFY